MDEKKEISRLQKQLNVAVAELVVCRNDALRFKAEFDAHHGPGKCQVVYDPIGVCDLDVDWEHEEEFDCINWREK